MSPSVSNSIDGSPIEVIFTSNLGQLYVGTDRSSAYSFDSKQISGINLNMNVIIQVFLHYIQMIKTIYMWGLKAILT